MSTTERQGSRIADLEYRLKVMETRLRVMEGQAAGGGNRRGRWKAKLDEDLIAFDSGIEGSGTATASLWKWDGGDLVDTGVDVEVRYWNSAHSSGAFVMVGKHQDGQWYVESADVSLTPFVLTEDIGATTSGEASATILEWDFSTTKHADETVLDNGGIFADGTSGSKGIAVKIGSDYHIIQLACGS